MDLDDVLMQAWQWEALQRQARALPLTERLRHARVPLNNRHRCCACLCCACLATLDAGEATI